MLSKAYDRALFIKESIQFTEFEKSFSCKL